MDIFVHVVVVGSHTVPVAPSIIFNPLFCVVFDDDYVARRMYSVYIATMNGIRVKEKAATFRRCHLHQALFPVRELDPIIAESCWRVVLHTKPSIIVGALGDHSRMVPLPNIVYIDEEFEPAPTTIVVPETRSILLGGEPRPKVHNFVTGQFRRLATKVVTGCAEEVRIVQHGPQVIKFSANSSDAIVIFPHPVIMEFGNDFGFEAFDLKSRKRIDLVKTEPVKI